MFFYRILGKLKNWVKKIHGYDWCDFFIIISSTTALSSSSKSSLIMSILSKIVLSKLYNSLLSFYSSDIFLMRLFNF